MLKKQILGLYLFFKYNFFKLKKIIDQEFEDNLEKTISKIYQKLSTDCEEILQKYDINYDLIKDNFRVFFEEDFPEEFYENDSGVVFYKGNWELLQKGFYKIAVVGSRKSLNVSSNFVTKFIGNLGVLKNVVVVSGLALGIDSIALKKSMENNIKTIAILGNGVDYYYPYANKNLQEKISQNGLLISEYLPNQKPEKYFFPYRNRLISAISDLVIVVQAGKNSGSIITGKYALEMGKNLLVPYLSPSEEFEGSKELINNGSTMITKPEEIFQFLDNILLPDNKLTINNELVSGNSIQEEKFNEVLTDEILKIVKNNPGISVEKIAEIQNLPLPEIMKKITLLEIQGRVSVGFNYSVYIT
ncbi:MAG: DNA-processing protein DprA [bacterium]